MVTNYVGVYWVTKVRTWKGVENVFCVNWKFWGQIVKWELTGELYGLVELRKIGLFHLFQYLLWAQIAIYSKHKNAY